MSLLPPDATFAERVQDCFAAYRGRGVSLSPLDLELVEEWEHTGVPFEVVARGLRRAAERVLFDAHETLKGPRALSWCKRDVRVEIDKHLKRSAGQHDGSTPVQPLHLARHEKLKAALKKLSKEHDGFAAPLTRLVAVLQAPADFDAAALQEELAWAVMLRALPFRDRSQLLQQARRLVQKAQPVSASGRRESRRFHRAALLKHRLNLKAFW